MELLAAGLEMGRQWSHFIKTKRIIQYRRWQWGWEFRSRLMGTTFVESKGSQEDFRVYLAVSEFIQHINNLLRLLTLFNPTPYLDYQKL